MVRGKIAPVACALFAVSCGGERSNAGEPTTTASEPTPPPVSAGVPGTGASPPSAVVLGELDISLSGPPSDFSEILRDESSPLVEGTLVVDLSRVVEDAPALGAPLPGVVDWLDTAEFRVPNPGWRVFRRTPKGLFLAAPDGHGDIIVFLFDEQRDVDELLAGSRLSRWRWREPRAFTLGEDGLPALVGAGDARSAASEPVTLLYAIVRGGAEHLLVLCAAKTRRGEEDLKVAAGIIGNVRRQASMER